VCTDDAPCASTAAVPVVLRCPPHTERSVGIEVFVDIEVNGGAGTDLVRITAAGSFVTLELVGAT